MLRRRRRSLGGLLIKALFALIVLGLLAYHFGVKTSELFPTKMIANIITENTPFEVTEKQLNDVLDVIDPKDLGELESVFKNHFSKEGITQLFEDFQNEEVGDLSPYFNGDLSQEEKDTINKLFDKYKDALGERIQDIIPDNAKDTIQGEIDDNHKDDDKDDDKDKYDKED